MNRLNIPKYLEFFLFASTVRFIVILGLCVILTLSVTWALAFLAFMGGEIDLPTLIAFLLFSLLKEFVFISAFGMYKLNYDATPHPEQQGYSAARCLCGGCFES